MEQVVISGQASSERIDFICSILLSLAHSSILLERKKEMPKKSQGKQELHITHKNTLIELYCNPALNTGQRKVTK